jgi:hypothetical protein
LAPIIAFTFPSFDSVNVSSQLSFLISLLNSPYRATMQSLSLVVLALQGASAFPAVLNVLASDRRSEWLLDQFSRFHSVHERSFHDRCGP